APVRDGGRRRAGAGGGRRAGVAVPGRRHKEAIAHVLVEEGFLAEAAMVQEGQFPTLRLGLRYDQTRRSVISGIRRVSRPSLRVYVGSGEIPAVRRGLGVSIL